MLVYLMNSNVKEGICKKRILAIEKIIVMIEVDEK
jgi:hypothetical protein